jgi:hypothetical protein
MTKIQHHRNSILIFQGKYDPQVLLPRMEKHKLIDIISANSHNVSAYPEINHDQPNQTNITTEAYVDPKCVLLQLADWLCTRIYWLTMIFAIFTY